MSGELHLAMFNSNLRKKCNVLLQLARLYHKMSPELAELKNDVRKRIRGGGWGK